jgi:hypothetical protein
VACLLDESKQIRRGGALDKVGGAYCAKLEECYKDPFKQAYPGGTKECVDTVKKGRDLNQLDACTNAEVDKCTTDTKALACTASITDLKLPKTCDKC